MPFRLVEQYKAKAEHCEREASFSQFPETRAEYRRLAEQWRQLPQKPSAKNAFASNASASYIDAFRRTK